MNILTTARAPFRISFFGGGTDYPAWYAAEWGAVLSVAIAHYCYVSARHLPNFFERRHRIVWSHIECVDSFSEILHPAVREGLRMLEFDEREGIEIHHQGDLPARTGLGSSSAFANALMLALLAMKNRVPDKDELYRLSLQLEQERLRENVGSQDQVATAVGGLNFIRFEGQSIDIQPVQLPRQRLADLESKLVLVYTGLSRLSSDIARSVIANLGARSVELREMRSMAEEGRDILAGNGSLDEFGRLLHQGWQLKRGLASGVTNPRIDSLYEAGLAAGALGGKLLGAGSAGFMLFYVPEGRRAAFRDAMAGQLIVDLQFDFAGASVIEMRFAPLADA